MRAAVEAVAAAPAEVGVAATKINMSRGNNFEPAKFLLTLILTDSRLASSSERHALIALEMATLELTGSYMGPIGGRRPSERRPQIGYTEHYTSCKDSPGSSPLIVRAQSTPESRRLKAEMGSDRSSRVGVGVRVGL